MLSVSKPVLKSKSHYSLILGVPPTF